MNVASVSTNTFHSHQKCYLQSSITTVWQMYQSLCLNAMKERGQPLRFDGDSRAETPGHSAKFGSYAMMDLDTTTLINFQLVHVRIFVLFPTSYNFATMMFKKIDLLSEILQIQ